jgi:uncharacterized protein YjbJ (UPF0337 family)
MLVVIKRPTFMEGKFFYNKKFRKMNKTELKGNWLVQKGKLKEKFAVLTDDDLLFEQGKKEEMLGKIQVKLGKTKEELQTIIEAL